MATVSLSRHFGNSRQFYAPFVDLNPEPGAGMKGGKDNGQEGGVATKNWIIRGRRARQYGAPKVPSIIAGCPDSGNAIMCRPGVQAWPGAALLPSMALAVKAQNAAPRRKIHSARLEDRRVWVHASDGMPSKSAAVAAEGVFPITS